MPAPPAYHMVVDPNVPMPSVQSPYLHEEEEEKEDDDAPEITINAATQVRGHGNIISIAQFDSVRIANLISVLLNEEKLPDPTSPATSETEASPSTTESRTIKPHARLNITVNCGATIIGDRNIVGPGLGDIARQMQVAQRNQALLAQQQQQQRNAAADQKVPPPTHPRETLYQAQAAIAQHHNAMYQAHGPTPPMSRTSSLQSDSSGGAKRKAEHDILESVAKKQC